MQREDLVDSTMGLVDSSFAPTTSRYLDACHSLAESVDTKVKHTTHPVGPDFITGGHSK